MDEDFDAWYDEFNKAFGRGLIVQRNLPEKENHNSCNNGVDGKCNCGKDNSSGSEVLVCQSF